MSYIEKLAVSQKRDTADYQRVTLKKLSGCKNAIRLIFKDFLDESAKVRNLTLADLQ